MTPGGELAAKLRQVENELFQLGLGRVKIVERSGTTIKQLLTKSNPWAGGPCQRPSCIVCKEGKDHGDCRRRNVVYETRCQTCQVEGVEKVYIGETARTAFERGLEHAQAYNDLHEESHMAKHAVTEHAGMPAPIFSMKVLKGHTSPMTRQIHEAVLIHRNESVCINSKGQYNRCQLPRLTVKMGKKVMEDNDSTKEWTDDEIRDALKAELRKRKDEQKPEPRPRKRRKTTGVKTTRKTTRLHFSRIKARENEIVKMIVQ